MRTKFHVHIHSSHQTVLLDFKRACLRVYFCHNELFRLLNISEVWKEKTVGGHLSCKAYNCRVLISWLSSCYSIVVSGACVPNRFVGQWLSDTNQEWPEHELIAPTAEAMTLEIYYNSVLHNLFVETTPCIILSNLDLLRNLLSTNMLLVESSPRYLCPGIGAAVSIYRIPTFVTGFALEVFTASPANL